MSEKNLTPSDQNGGLGILSDIIRRIRLAWLLFQDEHVPAWTKSIIPLSLIYAISPLDIVPDAFLGLGQLDDIGVIMLSLALFIKLSPPKIVARYLSQLQEESGEIPIPPDTQVVEGAYRLHSDEETK